MSEANPQKNPEPDQSLHTPSRGVIDAEIAEIEQIANQAGRNKDLTVRVDALVPVKSNERRLVRAAKVIKNVGRITLEKLSSGATVTWSPNSQNKPDGPEG